MSIEKISPSSDPHEPEGSGRKMRNVGDKFKKIERMQEVDPENRKKQKWATENDSPYEAPKSNAYNNSNAPSYAPKPSHSNPNASSPYSSNAPNNNEGRSNPSSNANGQDPNKSSKTEEGKESKKTASKEEDKKGKAKSSGFIEIDTPGAKKSLAKGPKSASLKPLDLEKKPLETSSQNGHELSPNEAKGPHEKEPQVQKSVDSPLESSLPKGVDHTDVKKDKKGLEEPLISAKKPHDKKEKMDKKERSLSKEALPLEPQSPHAIGDANVNNAAPIQGAVSSQFSHPEVARLFNELVSHITAISQKGIKEVTITLSSGTFKGSQIILTETSTALRNYNIQLLGATNDAGKLFAAHASELMEAFQAKPYPFKINRIDSGHLIRRKEDIDKEGQDSDPEGES